MLVRMSNHYLGMPCVVTFSFNYLPIEGNNARILPGRTGPLAQLAEQGTLNAKVRGSSPWRVTSPSTTVVQSVPARSVLRDEAVSK